ncbi:DUF397 domain-containing protein [Streptomyces sp. NPDC058291]|uniref:DUF397 domain-containing protein n=1 Tax=Streptomyces sp. NPDC058291 TaxID=3346427 RepID=UPI0036DFF324
MRALDLSNAAWRKSSYGNPDAGEWLEVSDDFLSTAAWRKSSYSNTTGGECLEVADHIPAVVPVRDSKNPERGALVFELGAWTRFVGALKRS